MNLSGLCRLLAALVAVQWMPLSASAQDMGTAVAVTQPAVLETAGARQTLNEGMTVKVDDVVRTGKTGKVQLVFSDNTKMVVGANAALKIDSLVLSGGNSKRRFAVTAIGGTFRFITGDSPKKAYQLKTPAATMGVRGTAFDFVVTGRRETGVVVFDGEVRFCGRGDDCARVGGGCSAVNYSRDDYFSQPESVPEKVALVADKYPLIALQAQLRPPFRVDTSRCGENRKANLPARNTDRNAPTGRTSGPAGGGSGSGNPAE